MMGLSVHPTAMTCHYGYTPQHAIFVLPYFSVLAKLIVSRDAALEVRVVGSGCSLAAMMYHLVLAAACESPSFSTMLDAYWLSNSLRRLRVLYDFAIRLSLAVAASWCTIKGSGGFKAARLAAVNMPVLASTPVMWWICSVESGLEELFPKFIVLGHLGMAISWLVIHTATGSKTMTWCVFVVSTLAVTMALLRKSYNLDPDGRVMINTTNDAMNPQWVAPLFFALIDSALSTTHAAALQAIISKSNPRPSPWLPTLVSSLLKVETVAVPAVPAITVLIAVISIIAFPVSILFPFSTTLPWHGRVRELLAMHTVQEARSMWWWAVASGVVFAVGVMARGSQHTNKHSHEPQTPGSYGGVRRCGGL